MRSVDRYLLPDEEVLYQARPSGKALVPAVAASVIFVPGAGAAAWFAHAQGVGRLVFFLPAVGLSLWIRRCGASVLTWYCTLYVLTTLRIVERRSLVSRTDVQIGLDSIVHMRSQQRIPEALLRYGHVQITSAGPNGLVTLRVSQPDHFQSRVRAAQKQLCARRSGGRVRDSIDQLQALARLRERDHVTDEEFAQQKRRLLG